LDFKIHFLLTNRFFHPDFLQFFIELASNNHKDWFDINRRRYETSVKEPFKEFISILIKRLSIEDDSFRELRSEDCIFRINRDIRFSKDKSPYKLFTSAIVAPGGKKKRENSGVYVELGPEHLRIYSGVYEADKDSIQRIRIGIAENEDSFKSLCNSPDFVALFGSVLGAKNKIVSSELKEVAKRQPLIYNKQWYYYVTFPSERILEEAIDDLVVTCYKVAKPMTDFFKNCVLS
jgi:uncharacterized protein (TIGR02453 family)